MVVVVLGLGLGLEEELSETTLTDTITSNGHLY
jgi:hypothetical protein